MSENFEKLVLEKLDLLNNKLENYQNITNERFDKVENNQLIINDRLDKIENNQKDIFNKITNLESQVLENSTTLSELKINQCKLERKLNNLTMELKDTQEIVIYNKNTLTKLEHDFDEKIRTLFDSWIINKDKHEVYDFSIQDLDSKIFNHDIRISILEDKMNSNNKVAED